MILSSIDWAAILAFLAISGGIGIYYARRAGRNPDEFFLSGRNLPWWLVGTSMVATTFAADTPLAVAGLVATQGVSGNWIWWSMAFGGALTIFFFARLWRRSGVTTDLELSELRYSGKGAAFLRGFRAVWLGLILNCVILAWVNLAMAKVLSVAFGWDRITAVAVCLLLAGLYSALSGLWGVVVTDLFQFVVATTGCVILAVLAVRMPEVGGLTGLVEKVPVRLLDFFPHFGQAAGDGAIALGVAPMAFFAFVAVQWWSSWYPGAEPGGGGWVAQRLLAAKDENHAFAAQLWFTVANYCIRPWPWILVGLVAVVVYPSLEDPELGFVLIMRDVAPEGVRGLMVGTFLAAYMSTVSTHLNWGASYVVHDLYLRFFAPKANDRQLVRASRAATVVLMVASAGTSFLIDNVADTWRFVLESSGGIGLVLLLRWYWWRVNAWSEIAAMTAALVGFICVKGFTDLVFPTTLFVQTMFTTLVWMAVTFATPAEPSSVLERFYLRVRPAGPGWRLVAGACGVAPVGDGRSIFRLTAAWLTSCCLIYGTLFGVGGFLLQRTADGIVWSLVAVVSTLVLWLLLRPGSEPVADPTIGRVLQEARLQ